MKPFPAIAVFTSLLVVTVLCQADTEGGKMDARKEFEKHCAACHPKGGNTINPNKTLRKKSLRANGITKAGDVVTLMRNPGPGMTRFDSKTISEKEAKAIADYVLKSFP